MTPHTPHPTASTSGDGTGGPLHGQCEALSSEATIGEEGRRREQLVGGGVRSEGAEGGVSAALDEEVLVEGGEHGGVEALGHVAVGHSPSHGEGHDLGGHGRGDLVHRKQHVAGGEHEAHVDVAERLDGRLPHGGVPRGERSDGAVDREVVLPHLVPLADLQPPPPPLQLGGGSGARLHAVALALCLPLAPALLARRRREVAPVQLRRGRGGVRGRRRRRRSRRLARRLALVERTPLRRGDALPRRVVAAVRREALVRRVLPQAHERGDPLVHTCALRPHAPVRVPHRLRAPPALRVRRQALLAARPVSRARVLRALPLRLHQQRPRPRPRPR
eukprot:Sspe_Gene.74023::Locus_45344_Transcript_1_1_Confidence_1.000_Length_1596::g.74023::m.74023